MGIFYQKILTIAIHTATYFINNFDIFLAKN